MAPRTTRIQQINATRERIMAAAERLFAEHGVFAVSNRQLSEAAGQGNNTAVSYHFGTKAELVGAIVCKHTDEIERLRVRAIEQLGESPGVRDWVACLVRPSTEYFATLGNPTWFCRFAAQVMTDPALRAIMGEESLGAPSLCQVIEGLNSCLPDLPVEVKHERGDMARQLMVHMCAERERALSEHTETPRDSWKHAATGLVDAVTGLLTAPVTPV